MNDKTKKPLPGWLPLVVGTLLVVQFAGLGAWQISRGFEKREQQQLYRDETSFTDWRHGSQVRSYQRVRVSGRYDAEHQFVLDNINVNGRYGHYVVTPLDLGDDRPMLLVNRGWIDRSQGRIDASRVHLTDVPVQVRGRAGSLPRAGYKMGDAIEPQPQWPKHAVYPNLDEIAAELGRPVQSWVLLMDADDENGFLRYWVPTEFGPSKHFGYALQWFAMAAVLAGLLVWNYRKRRFDA